MDGQDAVGYWIAREHWGRGIATRALGLLLEEVAIRPLHARAARTNAASIRVLERCGFRVTGYEHSPETERYPACEEAVLLLG
jgi:RimJ/RimL family protein N-acetyltransferase